MRRIMWLGHGGSGGRLGSGGWGGIRTHGTVSRTPVFKTGSLNRSDTHPASLS